MPNPSNSPNPSDAMRILDEQFLTLRARLIEIAANLDRIDRAIASEDADGFSADGLSAGGLSANGNPRMQQIRKAIKQLLEPGPGLAERLQLIFSLAYDEKTP